MPAVCLRCSHSYDPTGPCPRCGAVSSPVTSEAAVPGPRWQQTAWGRVLIGLILAQGLFYALRHLLSGILLAVGWQAEVLSKDPNIALLLQAIQLLTVLAGSVLAGGGQQQGLFLGLMVGAWNGVLTLIIRQAFGEGITAASMVMLPVQLAIFGALGGGIGTAIWQPIPKGVPQLVPTPRKPRTPRQPLFAGKVYWIRVLAGTALAVGGTLAAEKIFKKVLEVGSGTLSTDGDLQNLIITWEIKALAVLAGGALAGILTPNGLKQGLFVGLFATFILLGIHTLKTNYPLYVGLLTIISTFCLGIAGGWFGGQLLPPVAKINRRPSAFT
jgi:hypothetical protein